MFDSSMITAVTKSIMIDTANPNRDGTGTLVQLVAGGTNGSCINTIIVKAVGTTSPGMVRIFVKQSDTYYLLEEFGVPASDPSSVLQSYQSMVIFPGEYGFWLASGAEFYASTENAEEFNVFATGFTWS